MKSLLLCKSWGFTKSSCPLPPSSVITVSQSRGFQLSLAVAWERFLQAVEEPCLQSHWLVGLRLREVGCGRVHLLLLIGLVCVCVYTYTDFFFFKWEYVVGHFLTAVVTDVIVKTILFTSDPPLSLIENSVKDKGKKNLILNYLPWLDR